MSLETRTRYWQKKYEMAKWAHAEAMKGLRVGGPGVSLIALERETRRMERAARELRKLEREKKAEEER